MWGRVSLPLLSLIGAICLCVSLCAVRWEGEMGVGKRRSRGGEKIKDEERDLRNEEKGRLPDCGVKKKKKKDENVAIRKK